MISEIRAIQYINEKGEIVYSPQGLSFTIQFKRVGSDTWEDIEVIDVPVEERR